jgi:hypothetical protein
MAKGIYTKRGSTAANGNVTVDTPAANEAIYVIYLTITVSVAGTTSRVVVTDAAAGAALARMATVTADAILNLNYSTVRRDYPGNKLTTGNALVITTSGGAAATIDYDVTYEIR